MNKLIPIFHISGRFFSNSQKAFTLENENKLGEKKDNKIIYSIYESLYLVEYKKAEFRGKKPKLNKDMQNNYIVFKDLRKKGYVVKAGLKFGADFRVYRKSDNHAFWIVYPISESSKINLKEFSAKNRVANSTNKKLLLAIVDSEEDVSYYQTNWIKP